MVDKQIQKEKSHSLDIMSKEEWNMSRRDDLIKCMVHHLEARTKFSKEWVDEYNEIIDRLSGPVSSHTTLCDECDCAKEFVKKEV